MKTLRIALGILLFPMICCAQTTGTGYVLSSTETKRPVLLIFSGSDWCAPCIRFEKNILSESSFLSFANESLTIIKADFPQRKKISDDQKKQNEALAEQYNPKGLFPHLVLLSADHSIIATLNYSNQSPDEFISEVRSHFNQQQSPSNE